jgi:hypothetical protein
VANPDRIDPRAAAFWGPIQLAARIGATTAETWAAIRAHAASSGAELPPGMFTAVNTMRSLATGLRRGSEAIERAGPGDAITSRMIGQQLYARSTLERSLAPAYHVRFELTTTSAEGVNTGWYTLEYPGSLPATVGDLIAEVSEYAGGLADSYGIHVGELGAIEVGEF